jgi:hypothetical protein
MIRLDRQPVWQHPANSQSEEGLTLETEPKGADASATDPEKPAGSGGETKQPAQAASEPTEGTQANAEKQADKQGAQPAGNGNSESDKAQHQTIYRLLDEALEAAPPPKQDEGGRAYKHPLYVDFLLAGGLLVAMGGFTIGLMKIYITHSAEQSITQRNYKAAIAILKDAPLPGFFQVYGKDPQELLNQALYLEAMEKLDANSEDESALRELGQITPGSRFFDFAQEIIKDHTKPSATQLQGHTEHEASPSDRAVEDTKIVIPPEARDDSSTSGEAASGEHSNPSSDGTSTGTGGSTTAPNGTENIPGAQPIPQG